MGRLFCITTLVVGLLLAAVPAMAGPPEHCCDDITVSPLCCVEVRSVATVDLDSSTYETLQDGQQVIIESAGIATNDPGGDHAALCSTVLTDSRATANRGRVTHHRSAFGAGFIRTLLAGH